MCTIVQSFEQSPSFTDDLRRIARENRNIPNPFISSGNSFDGQRWGLEFVKVLRVDLTTGEFADQEISKDDCKKFLGGRGLAAKILYEEN
ncbi:MAG: hypothetical protein NTY62_07250, partial [Euryarchaeota archaeon]|nr:hypothetical protein [Euryarchaeota archaeon]